MKAGFSCEDQPCVVIRTDVVLATLPATATFGITGTRSCSLQHWFSPKGVGTCHRYFACSTWRVPICRKRVHRVQPVLRDEASADQACASETVTQSCSRMSRFMPSSSGHISMGSRVCGALIQQTAYGASVRGGGPFCILRALSTLRKHNNSQSMPTTSSPVYSFQFYDGGDRTEPHGQQKCSVLR